MPLVRFVLVVLCTIAIALSAVDLCVRALFPHPLRLSEDFSQAYLMRVVTTLHEKPKTVVLGDSVMWGYGVDAQQSAAALLAQDGAGVENLSFQGGSSANTYAMLRILQANGVRAQRVIFNVNIKEFNPEDSAYRRLYPAVEHAAWPFLAPDDRSLLTVDGGGGVDKVIDARLSNVWALYGMRSDIRDLLFGRADAASALAGRIEAASGEEARERAAHLPTPDRFLGTYDLTPIASDNVAYHFLGRIARLLRDEGVPAYAVLTPANHALLHDYIDVPEYRENLRTVARLLVANGIHVLDYDRAFPSSEFIDNDHLTAAGNLHLARALRRDAFR